MVSQGVYFEGDCGIIVPYTMFLVSSSINVSNFHSTWPDTFWRDLICSQQYYSQQQKVGKDPQMYE